MVATRFTPLGKRVPLIQFKSSLSVVPVSLRPVLLALLVLLPLPALSMDDGDPQNVNHDAVFQALQQVCSTLNTVNQPTSAQTLLSQSCQTVDTFGAQGFVLNLDRLSPEEVLIFQDSIVTLSDSRINNMLLRLNQLRYTRPGSDGKQASSGAAYSDTGGVERAKDPLSVFANARTSVGQYESESLQKLSDNFALAVTVGAQYQFNRRLLAGVALGFIRQETDFFPTESDSYMNGGNLSVFGTWLKPTLGYADLVVDVGYNRFNLKRKTNLFNESRQFAIGRTDATVFSLAATVGRDFTLLGFNLGPYASLTIIEASIDGFTETALGPDGTESGALLNVGSHSARSQKIAAGGQFSRAFGKRVRLIPQLRIELQKELQESKSGISASFVADTSQTQFVTTGDTRDTLYLNTALGLELAFGSRLRGQAFVVSRWQDDLYLQHWLKFGLNARF